jgi:transposase
MPQKTPIREDGLSLASIGALLARLGLTPQKPLQRAYERDPEAWKAEIYPKLAARASMTLRQAAAARN